MKKKLNGFFAFALCAALLLSACGGRTAVESGGSSSDLTVEEPGSSSQITPEPDSSSQTSPEQPENNQEETEDPGTEDPGTEDPGTETEQESVPVVTVSETVRSQRCDEQEGTVLLDYVYNTVTVSVPGNEAATAAIQADLDELMIEQDAKAISMAQESEENQKEFSGVEYYLSGLLTLTRADSAVISFRYDVITYAGGAHDNSESFGISYDTATGERLTLDSLGEDVTEISVGICQQLAQKIADDDEYFFFDGYLEGVESSVVTDNTFWLTEDGIIFIDNEYVLQAYAAGTVEFFVPYSALSDAMESVYLVSGTGAQASATLAEGTVYTLE